MEYEKRCFNGLIYGRTWNRTMNLILISNKLAKCLLVGAHGIEPWTSFLSGMRSTTELRTQIALGKTFDISVQLC